MPQIDYSKTVIYKIVCNDLNITDCYVGHTTNFRHRKSRHKDGCNYENDTHYNYKVYQIMRKNGGWDNWSMIEIEKYPCIDSNEARARERFWYEELKPKLNSRLPFITKKEYLETHREHKREYDMIYRDKNRERLLEAKRLWSKQRYEKIKQQKAEATV